MEEIKSHAIEIKLSFQEQPICPFLALRSDRTVVTGYATEQHACYNRKRAPSPSLEHQQNFCLGNRYVDCPYYSQPTAPLAQLTSATQPQFSGRSGMMMRALGAALILLLMIFSAFWVRSILTIDLPTNLQAESTAAFTMPNSAQPNSAQSNSTQVNQALAANAPLETTSTTATNAPAIADSLLPTITPVPAQMGTDASGTLLMIDDRFVTPTPQPGGQVLYLSPGMTDVAWWLNGAEGTQDVGTREIGDSFLYAGQFNQQTYITAMSFDLSRAIRGATINQATLRLTGLRNVDIAPTSPKRWIVQFIAQDQLSDFAKATFLSVFSAPAAITLLPEIAPMQLAVNQVNEWALDANVRLWLEQQILNGATSVTVRIMASSGNENGLFAWDSGQGSESNGSAPGLLLSFGPPPATPPPVPTKPVIVATLTPLPANVLTVVAQASTATAEATTFGTSTPNPYDIVTPTPMPENLATVQANALAQGLPPVVLNTPVPANAATAEADSAYATAVALTTGTFTPVPTGYVTPMLLYPPPPAENVATAAARVEMATREANSGQPTPTAPWNGINAIYVYATPTPASAEEAAAQIREQNAAVLTTGTPTPTPWNLVVITPVPPPLPTEIPIIVPADQLEATPTPVPTTPATAQDLSAFRGMVLFLSNRTGSVETWAMDPSTGEILYLVRDPRLHPLARELYLANSPDGTSRAIVEGDDNRDLQIKVYSNLYQVTQQLTHFNGATSYDPAWSPDGAHIAFVSTESGGDEIYTMDTQGNNIVRLTYNTWEWDKHPSWSPDSSQLVFYSNRDSGRKQIWVMNADGSNQRNLSNNEFEDWDPVWIR